MFTSFTTRLQQEVSTIKTVLDTHDSLRALLFRSAPEPQPDQAAETKAVSETELALDVTRRIAPPKPAWQIYDHCAAFTRLYAVYEQFVDDLVSEYLRMLPSLYPRYEELPPNVTTQHRVGVAQILQKLGKDGPYKTLEERSIIQNLAHGLLGNPNYVLLTDAFLIDPQNYRSEVITRLFSHLGFDNSWAWVEKHPSIAAFMLRRRDPNETAATLLHDFVEYRNEASHSAVGGIVATEEIKSIADFVVALSDTLTQLVMKQVVQRKKQIGEAISLGYVIHKFSGGIVGARMFANVIAVGDPVVVMQKQACHAARIESIQIEQTPHQRLELQNDQEVGLRLSAPANDGAQLIRILTDDQTPPTPLPETISPDEFPVDHAARTSAETEGDPHAS